MTPARHHLDDRVELDVTGRNGPRTPRAKQMDVGTV